MWRSGYVLLATLVATQATAALDDYGVVIGQPTAHYLEPVQGEGNWPHYVVEVATPEGPYRAVINVYSRADEQVLHREVAMSPYGNYRGIFGLSDGLHRLPFHTRTGAATGGALDFQRHPSLLKDIGDTPWNTWPPVENGNSVPAFDQLFAGVQRVYIFGEPYFNSNGSKGVHDVHQNQGNAAGTTFARLNGVYQDGAMILEYTPTWSTEPERTLVMTRFQVQRDFTDRAGDGLVPSSSTANGSASSGGWVNYGPFNAGQIQVEVTTTAGNPDVYLRVGSRPTTSSYRLASRNAAGQNEFLRDNTGGSTYIAVRANGAFSRWSIKTSWLPPSP
ncbi:YukJ family protein [Tahibacter amnicola]|uniref:YukJ family protein n=1 Tax=Tahibacter amnicola TaxID=2976241 RepID=A0ABY6BQB9_9GAMM|nr:YukJ family protein [Tahibacter amnicola]UXI69972.1 YukJ family protein [Tahibacter amnicola]